MVARAAPSSRPPDAIASALSGADFARILAPATGDAVAAAAILDSALACPTQLRPLAPADDPAAIAAVGDATDTTILLDDAAMAPEATADAIDVRLSGRGATSAAADTPEEPTGDAAHDRPLSIAARAVARRLGADPGPQLVLAGAVAAGATPTTVAPDLVERAIGDGVLDRRPGVATPTADIADGIAHSTLLAGPFSGDPEAASATLESLAADAETDQPDGRGIASDVVCSILENDATPVRAATAVERAIRPLVIPEGSFDTVCGLADVLDATARTDPGLAIAMALRLAGSAADDQPTALDGDTVDAALSAWREFAREIHAVVAPGDTGTLATARTDLAPTQLPTVARLHRDFQVRSDAVAVTGDSALAIAGSPARTTDIAGAVTEAAPSQPVLRVTVSSPGVVLATPLDDGPDSMLDAVRAVIEG